MGKPYYQDDYVTIHHGDCKEILPDLGTFDLLLTDPPYGKVKGHFDHEWTNRPAMLKSCKEWLDVMVPAMKPNATLYWFAWPSLAGRIEVMIAEKLNTLAHIIWKKPTPMAQKAHPESLRAPMPETERILMAEHYGADNMALGESGYQAKCDNARGHTFKPIIDYLEGERKRAGVSRADCDKACGVATMASRHYFGQSQWRLPTEEHYKSLQAFFNGASSEYKYLRKEYECLRKEYEELRRYFNCEKGDYKTDVWEFSPNLEKVDHPTPKPLKLIRFMIKLSCRPGGTIIDPFAGSGTTGRAAKDLGRKCVLIEREERYCEVAAKRMSQEVLNFEEPITAPDPQPDILEFVPDTGCPWDEILEGRVDE